MISNKGGGNFFVKTTLLTTFLRLNERDLKWVKKGKLEDMRNGNTATTERKRAKNRKLSKLRWIFIAIALFPILIFIKNTSDAFSL